LPNSRLLAAGFLYQTMPDLTPKIKQICRLFQIEPSRSKGQNFLVSEKVYDDIVAAAEINPEDIIFEVGPGLGFLTAKLAKLAKQVVAIELDDKLAGYLRLAIEEESVQNVEVINGDILKFDFAKYFQGREYKVVANLPYNITSLCLRQFLSSPHPPLSLTLMLQKEVAERIVARPPQMSLLALSVQYYAEAKIIRPVKAGSFWPEPKVDSAVIRLVLKPAPLPREDETGFFRLARVGFSGRRKMLKNNLASGFKCRPAEAAEALKSAGLGLKLRAEDLSLENWLKLFASFRSFVV